ncbi:hypothetical protein [Sphingomonas sp. 3-13AW]|jgi:hypothetical protein|uniref:hypothetical protein n=1 Tax=Sphingomonas sp. 3-13AW TaxID=3050450 RepID=UPI003BB570BF
MFKFRKLQLLVAVGALTMAGCARKPEPAPPPPPAPAPAPAPAPMPTPPSGSATGLNTPTALPDGSYPTPNRALSSAGAVWHLRSALNVAALQCNVSDPSVVAQYNALIKTQAKTLAAAYKALSGEYRKGGGDWEDRFDDSMTRVYNFFAQPPVQKAFCDRAVPMMTAAAALPAGGFESFAAGALAQLDQPFVDFYRRYDMYRVELAAWKSGGQSPIPRLGVDPVVLLGSNEVTLAKGVRVASR